MSWWQYLIILYFSASFMVCLAAIGDMIEQGVSDCRWYHLVRAFAFCIFLAPGCLCWWTVKGLWEYFIEKLESR